MLREAACRPTLSAWKKKGGLAEGGWCLVGENGDERAEKSGSRRSSPLDVRPVVFISFSRN